MGENKFIEFIEFIEKGTRGIWLLAGTILFCFFILPIAVTQFSTFVSFNQESGLIGDTIGGIVNPAIAFIGALLTFAAFYIQYKANMQQSQAIKLQQFDSTFFNYLERHQSVIERLQETKRVNVSEKFEALKKEYEYLNASFISIHDSDERKDRFLNNRREIRAYVYKEKDFFDNLYYTLDKNYKKHVAEQELIDKNYMHTEHQVKPAVNKFFKDLFYLFGHYIRGYFAIIEFVHNNTETELTKEQKEFYVSVLRDNSTTDELRLLIYATIWKADDDEGKKWKHLLTTYDFLKYLGNNEKDSQLINPESDIVAFLRIL